MWPTNSIFGDSEDEDLEDDDEEEEEEPENFGINL